MDCSYAWWLAARTRTPAQRLFVKRLAWAYGSTLLQLELAVANATDKPPPLLSLEDQGCPTRILRVPHGHDTRQVGSNLDTGPTVIAAGALVPHGTGQVEFLCCHPAPPSASG